MDNFNFMRVLQDGWIVWINCAKNAVVGLVNGFMGVVCAILFGAIKALYALYVLIKRFVVRFPIQILMFLCMVLFWMWLFTFVGFKVKIKTCEWQRDSIGYELYKIEQALQGDTIIIGMKKESGLVGNEQ